MDKRVADLATGTRPDPVRIAYYTDPRGWGGAEVYLTDLVTRIGKHGYEPHVFCADRHESGAWADDLALRGVPVTRFRPRHDLDPRGLTDGLRLLSGYGIVHVNRPHPRTCLAGVAAARLVRARVVVTEHLAGRPVSHYPCGAAFLTRLIRCVNRAVDRTIAVSELSRRMLERNYGIPDGKLIAIRNGTDLSEWGAPGNAGAVRESLGIDPEDFVAVHVGAMIERKGHQVALLALPDILQREPRFRYVFVGEGELEEELRAEAARLGVADSVVFAGFRRDVPAILSASDLLVLPSDIECLPLVILEAMASRLPVVATDVGGVSEAILDGITGRLIRPRDPDGLTAAVLDVLESPGRGREMGEAGRRRAREEFDIDACVAAVAATYDEVLGAARPRGGAPAK